MFNNLKDTIISINSILFKYYFTFLCCITSLIIYSEKFLKLFILYSGLDIENYNIISENIDLKDKIAYLEEKNKDLEGLNEKYKNETGNYKGMYEGLKKEKSPDTWIYVCGAGAIALGLITIYLVYDPSYILKTINHFESENTKSITDAITRSSNTSNSNLENIGMNLTGLKNQLDIIYKKLFDDK